MKVRGDNVLPLPAHVSYEDAASFILTNMTAWRMVVTQGQLRAGQDVLILGVGGGVSSTAVQIAKLCGARVIVTSSSDAKLERARQLGADVGINYAREDWAKAVFEKTRPARRGPRHRERGRRDVEAVDPLRGQGRAGWSPAAPRPGPIGETDIRIVFWNQISIIGSTMANRKEFHDVMRLFFAGRLRAIVDEVVPLKDGAAAQRRLAEGQQFGKIVLTV